MSARRAADGGEQVLACCFCHCTGRKRERRAEARQDEAEEEEERALQPQSHTGANMAVV